jgi:predicted DsbA family dithiol-disulfide isomerase
MLCGMSDAKPELRVTVFSDYICPFCYIGSERLQRLRADYELRVNWCHIEIHPETPAGGWPIERLGYDPARWRQLMASLRRLAAEEGLDMREHDFTTSSHSALLLAEAAKEEGAPSFYALHQRLFDAFFRDGRNIGDREVLATLAAEVGMGPEVAARAWSEARYAERLGQYLAAARELQVQATPTFFIGDARLDGAVPLASLEAAARAAVAA